MFLLFFPMMANADTARVMRLLSWGGVGLAIAAVYSIVLFYCVQAQPRNVRLYGVGKISYPILGAYVIAAAIIWMLHWYAAHLGVAKCLGLGVGRPRHVPAALPASRCGTGTAYFRACHADLVLRPLWLLDRGCCYGWLSGFMYYAKSGKPVTPPSARA
ncbi:hypothetical protein [Pseudomonas donghuensis]|uniref:hypothetical protein n=1 Tax=Pseudomonas donghuensis TaxID=1163398 RepID=UPI003B8316B5